MLFDADINYLAVVLAGVAAQPLGFLWYGMLFGDPWRALRGVSEEEATGSSTALYLVPLVCSLVIAYGLARLVDMVGADSVGDCIAVAAFVWISFAATVQLTQINFSPAVTGKAALFGIEGGYQLACFVIAGAIIGCFQ